YLMSDCLPALWTPPRSLDLALPPDRRLLDAFLAGRATSTLKAYGADLKAFARWAGSTSITAAVAQLLACARPRAVEVVLAWRNALVAQGLASATIARRLSTLRALAQLGRLLGLIGWDLADVQAPPVESYRDTAGPGVPAVRRMLEALAGRRGAKARRDAAIVRLLFDVALRRGPGRSPRPRPP